jgi:hypothetical protein
MTKATQTAFLPWAALLITTASASAAPSTQPARPAWINKDFSQWPQIWLTNEVRFSNNTGLSGEGGFLMRLPSGIVVGATVKHIAATTSLADLNSKWASWAMFAPSARANYVRLSRPVEKSPDGDSLDWLVMLPSSQSGPWPSIPLPARIKPIELGETVYVIAAPRDSDSRQTVYKAAVTSTRTNSQFGYSIPGATDSRAFTGAPIIDANGESVGIHFGHTQDAGQFVGIETTGILGLIQLPPNVVPAPAMIEAPAAIAKQKPDSGGEQATSPADEAEHALRVAQLMIDNKLYDRATEKLQSIIDTYPSTPAAEKAKKLLSDIENQ